MSQQQMTFEPEIYSVSKITNGIKNVLERNFSNVLVEGELSNVKRSTSGHYYLTLKDADAQIPCVIWRSTAQRMGLDLADGQQVVAGGNVEVYAPHGRYQLIVRTLQQAGIGALQQKFEKLKAKLQEEGFFDQSHKQPLPSFPRTIGVITSATSAAFQDIRSTLEKRFPLAQIKLYHASVQGLNAAPEIARGLTYFSQKKDVDLIITGRGGGSLEDLWPFNEEVVARAIYHCPIPVVSAVGHEIDYSISDFVADARAATPTHAVVIATPDVNELRFYLDDLTESVRNGLKRHVQQMKERFNTVRNSYVFARFDEYLRGFHERVDRKKEQLTYRMESALSKEKNRYQSLRHRLELQNPNQTLELGYTRIHQEGAWIKSMTQFSAQQPFEIEWKDGKVEVGQK